jgi:hypothetical protein
LLTYKTLLEVKAQRESTYRPDLIIEQKDFVISSSPEGNYYKKSETSSKKKAEVFLIDNFSEKFEFRIFNIGLATAKDVHATFTLDLSKSFSLIEKLNKKVPEENQVNLKLEKNFLHFSGKKNSMHIIDNQLTSRLNHILPVNILNDSAKIFFPAVILDIYTIYISHFWSAIKPKTYSEFPEFPSIKLKLEYQDIGNKTHFKEFELNLKFNGGFEKEAWNSLETKQLNCA